MTMGEKSRVVIEEFIYSREKGGKSIFNLLDGKMKSVVGKAGFEVHTPTAVAAARGTVIFFDVGVRDGKLCTTILCTEGEVVAGSADETVKDVVSLTSDTIVTICEGMPFPTTPLRAQNSEKEKMIRATRTLSGMRYLCPYRHRGKPGCAVLTWCFRYVPQIPNQQPVSKTPVTIDLIFK